MQRLFLAVIATFSLALPCVAEERPCPSGLTCETFVFELTSVSDDRSYGIFLVVPEDAVCTVVRFRVRLPDAHTVGQTPPLRPGQGALVRIGRGFAAGTHPLHIDATGCWVHPVETRRVTLAKSSPDHGWRAAIATSDAVVVRADY